MRSFLLGIAVGAIVTMAIVKLIPARYAPVSVGRRLPTSVGSASSEPICGRDTFNINVTVPRLPGSDNKDPYFGPLATRLDVLVDGLHGRIDRAGLRHEFACPVMLDIFGMVHENQQQGWMVSAHVKLTVASNSTMVYPSWDSGEYRALSNYVHEAEADLERVLVDRVQRFLMYFGKPENGRVALPVPGTGRQ